MESYNSYFTNSLGSKTILLFNTYSNKENIDKTVISSTIHLNLVVLSEDGSIEKNEAVSTSDERSMYYHPEYTKASTDRVLVNLFFGNKFNFGVVDLSGL